MTSFLVTGGAGFIGSHITQELVQNNHKVRILDNFSTGKMDNLSGFRDDIEILEGDLRNPDQVRRAVSKINVIFHEAAFVSNPQSILDPIACFEINVHGTETLLEEARKAGVKRIILASSSAVYGNTDEYPLSENCGFNPMSPYSASKCINEVYAGMYTRAYGLEVVSLRYFNVFGPRQNPDSEYAAAIPIFIRCLMDGKPITIFGDGGQTRDLIFVRDVVQANIKASEQPAIAGEVFNICSGSETSVEALVEILRKQFPDPLVPKHVEPRNGDIYRSVGRPDKASERLKFEPKTSLLEGLMETIEWMRTCH